jgi:hypothetical protein
MRLARSIKQSLTIARIGRRGAELLSSQITARQIGGRLVSVWASLRALLENCHGGERAMTTSTSTTWTAGDWNAFFGFGTNILVNMLVLTACCGSC